VQLPLALGVMVAAPLVHWPSACWPRSSPCRRPPTAREAVYNLAAAAFEVGAVSFAVGLVETEGFPPQAWLALAVGLLAGEAVSSLVMSANWRLVGMPVTLRQARPLVLSPPMACCSPPSRS
jgi:hypothetical protein